MKRIRRKWLMAAGIFLGVAAGSALAQELELPAPRSWPSFALPQNPDLSAQPPTPVGPSPPPGTFRERLSAACRKYFLGYVEEFEAVPLGHDVHVNMETQVLNGEAARMVLYQFDFVDQTSCLNLRGKDQLAKVAAMLDHNFFPIVIERTPAHPELAEARRLAVLNALAAGPFPVPPMRVVIGQPPATGLQGREANLIYLNLLNMTRSGGIGASPTLVQGTASPTTSGTSGGGAAASVPTSQTTVPSTGGPEGP